MRNIGLAVLAGGLLSERPVQRRRTWRGRFRPRKGLPRVRRQGQRALADRCVHRADCGRRSGRRAAVTLIGRPENIAPVKAELVRQGVSPQAIVVKTEARAPIAKPVDGLSNPIDRRVEIKF